MQMSSVILIILLL